MLLAADLRRCALHSGPLALAEAIEALGPGVRPLGTMSIGARVTVVALHDEVGRVERYRVPIGEEDLAAAVSEELGIPTAEAHDRLRGAAEGVEAEAIAKVLRRPFGLLASDVSRLLDYQRSREDGEVASTLHLLGDVANLPLVRRALRSTPELRWAPLPAPDRSALARSGRADRPELESAYPRLAAATGAALLGSRPGDPRMALRPLPPAPERVRVGLHLTASVLVLLLVLAMWAVAGERHQRIRGLHQRQERLDDGLPRSSLSPEDLARDRERIDLRLDLLERKTATLLALRAVGALTPATRVGQSYRLSRLELDGNRVEAELEVRLRARDALEAAIREDREAVPRRLRDRQAADVRTRVEPVAGGYRIHATWSLRP
jgi:hypothetical protein